MGWGQRPPRVPLGRAQRTAEPTAKAHGLEIETLDWLMEFPAAIDPPYAENGINAPKRGCPWNMLPQYWTKQKEFYDPDKWSSHPLYSDGTVQKVVERIDRGWDELTRKWGYVRNGQIYDISPDADRKAVVALFCHLGLGNALISRITGAALPFVWQTMFLPTSYQWEFACRAGSCMRLYSGSQASSGADVDALCWHTGNNADDPDWYNDSDGRYLPHVVGLKTPNAWGLYDMLGNVDEMCVDAWAASPIRNADGTPVVDSVGPWASADTTQRVVRGGNMMNDSKYLCAGYQINGDTTAAYLNRGFRLACDVEVSR